MTDHVTDLDLLVVGSGIAGLTAALRAADRGLRVAVVTKGTVDPYLTTSTRYEGKSTKAQIVPRTGAIKG